MIYGQQRGGRKSASNDTSPRLDQELTHASTIGDTGPLLVISIATISELIFHHEMNKILGKVSEAGQAQTSNNEYNEAMHPGHDRTTYHGSTWRVDPREYHWEHRILARDLHGDQ